MEQINLFNQLGIERHFSQINDKFRKQLRQNLQRIKDGDPEIIAREIATQHKVNCPVFDFPNTKTTVQRLPESNRFEVFLTDFAFYEIPFTGDNVVLKCRPDRTNCVQPFPLPVELHRDKIEFSLNSQGYMDNPGQPRDRVKTYINSIKDYIECSITSLQESIDIFNGSLEQAILNGVIDVKTKLVGEDDARKEIEDDLNPFKD